MKDLGGLAHGDIVGSNISLAHRRSCKSSRKFQHEALTWLWVVREKVGTKRASLIGQRVEPRQRNGKKTKQQ